MRGLFKRIRKLEKEVLGRKKEYVCGHYDMQVIPAHIGLLKRVADLEKENAKLKAVVAELTDYVYREGK